MRGGIQREAERGGAGVAERIGLARHDGVGAVGKPARGERPGPGGVGGHGGGDGAAVDAEMHHGAGKPGAGQRIVRGDVVAGRVPVSMVSASVSVGPVVLRLKTTAPLLPVLPAASVSLAIMLWLPLPDSVTPVLQLPSLPTVAVPSAVALPLSNSVTVLPASPVPVMVCAAWLIGPPCCRSPPPAVVSSVSVERGGAGVAERIGRPAVTTSAPWPAGVIDVVQWPPPSRPSPPNRSPSASSRYRRCH